MVTTSRSFTSRASIVTRFVLVVVTVLAASWWLFLRDGGDGAVAPPKVELPNSVETAQMKPVEPTRRQSARPRAPMETFKVFASKDPFEPLVESSGIGTVTDDTGQKVSATSDGKSSSNAGPTTKSKGTTVTLVDVTETSEAEVDVAGESYRVARGERFAKSFKLLIVDGKCVSMLYGDDQFALCKGEAISK